MKRLLLILLVLSLALATSAWAAQLQPGFGEPPDLPSTIGYAPQKIVVKFAPDTVAAMDHQGAPQGRLGLPALDHLGARHGVSSIKAQFPGARKRQYKGRVVDLSGWHVLHFHNDIDGPAVARAYREAPGVLDAQPVSLHPVYKIPAEQFYGYQWHLPKIQAPQAWDIQTGSPAVTVAIADTGVRYFAKDLGGTNASYSPSSVDPTTVDGNMWINGAEKNGTPGADDDGNDKTDDWVGWDFVDGVQFDLFTWPIEGEDYAIADNDPRDFNGHGTHCAGIVACMNNNREAVASLAGGWLDGSQTAAGNGVKLMALRVGYAVDSFLYGDNVGFIEMDFAAQAFYYAANNGARIISCSWGSENTGGIEEAVDYFLAGGGRLVFKAAGNENNENNSGDYLCTRPDVIKVAATDQNDRKASFSSYGTWVDVSAPGVSIWSLYHFWVDPAEDYVTNLSGTSMASPMAAGVAALIWSQNPGWSAAQVKEKLFSSADNIDAQNPNYVGKLGAGRINAYKAVSGGAPPTNQPPVAQFTFTTNGLSVSFNGSDSYDPDGTITAYNWNFGDGVTGTGAIVSHTYAATGTYQVTLTVTDNQVAQGSRLQNVTVTAPATTMHVGDLDGTKTGSKKNWQTSVTVRVQNNSDQPVVNATVSGIFTNLKRGNVSGVTNSAGNVTFTKSFATNVSSTTFAVTNVTHATLSYQSSDNHDPDGDSNGTTITVTKP